MIVSPRSLGRIVDLPCDALGAAQRTHLGLDDGGQGHISIDHVPSCMWHGTKPVKYVDVGIVVHRDLLVDRYRSRRYPIFRPLVVDGAPAVEQQSAALQSVCTTTVGVAERQSLDITTGIAESHNGVPAIDPCAEGRRVAEAIVSTLPPLHA